MATFNETIVYLLARLIQIESGGEDIEQTLIDAENFWSNIHKSTGIKPVKVSQEDIDKVYALYPQKCPFRNAYTGKCAKNKAQIETLIKKFGFENVYRRVETYVKESKKEGVYLKNFGTLLNNLPEYDTTEEKQKDNLFNWQ